MRNIESISKWIEEYSADIVGNISRESIDVYNFIKSEYETSNVTTNHLFQFVFRSFYRMDNAGLTPDFKTEYFILLEENRKVDRFDFDKVLRRLYTFPNRKGQNTLQFSFATKMFNTIDHSMPIYDSEVCKMFSLSRPYQREFDVKLDKYLDQLDVISKGYEEIRKFNLLPNAMGMFDNYFKDHALTEWKKLDFIFWSAGKLQTVLSKTGDNGYHTLEELDKLDAKSKRTHNNGYAQ
ncbi:hypothetical protein PP178_00720 [Zeaxanthinibacter sp. PT1]|uniref:hypothetical protein n=1 Tax=Zeaxanthinibacter TaxID=561554 RepID=UPI00234951F8|nr:hypothetical protein [Zeaxanthinibacter sp. PT1]MDC6350059.1 hypothetical protein [Zeaxanthinibacter sp. PT1]